MARLARAFASVGLAVVWVGVSASAVFAFHEYSVGYEINLANCASIAVTRSDVAVTQNQTGCQAYFTGNAIYQTESLVDNYAQKWLEIGTGHQCADTWRYHYWGVASGGMWTSLGTEDFSSLTSHTYRIVRSGLCWEFKIDTTSKDIYCSTHGGYDQAHAGLESYAPSGYVVAYSNSNLQYKHGSSGWVDWSGRDGMSVGSSMCGHWASDTDWHSAEAASC